MLHCTWLLTRFHFLDFEFYDEFMKSDEEPQQFSMPDAAVRLANL